MRPSALLSLALSIVLIGGPTACGGGSSETGRIDPSVPKVRLRVWTEAIDPCSPQWVQDFLRNVWPAVGEILDVERYLDGTANPDGTTDTFHGRSEFLANKYEACVQHQSSSSPTGGHLESLRYTSCVNGECFGPGRGFLGLDFCEHTGELLRGGGQAPG